MLGGFVRGYAVGRVTRSSRRTCEEGGRKSRSVLSTI